MSQRNLGQHHLPHQPEEAVRQPPRLQRDQQSDRWVLELAASVPQLQLHQPVSQAAAWPRPLQRQRLDRPVEAAKAGSPPSARSWPRARNQSLCPRRECT